MVPVKRPILHDGWLYTADKGHVFVFFHRKLQDPMYKRAQKA